MGSVNAQGQEARRRRKLKSVPKHRNRGQLRFCQDRRALKGMAGSIGQVWQLCWLTSAV
jgi:hypothetical protein